MSFENIVGTNIMEPVTDVSEATLWGMLLAAQLGATIPWGGVLIVAALAVSALGIWGIGDALRYRALLSADPADQRYAYRWKAARTIHQRNLDRPWHLTRGIAQGLRVLLAVVAVAQGNVLLLLPAAGLVVEIWRNRIVAAADARYRVSA